MIGGIKLERPILFNTEMVKAILEGRKTQTRRIIKPQPLKPVPMGFVIAAGRNSDIGKFCFGDSEYGGYNTEYFKPAYTVGDILWVRETWCKADMCNHEFGCNCPAYIYKADGWSDDGGWKPSIHMPRAAARLFLRVTDVRVERLHDITEDGAIKEGTPYELCGGWHPTYNDPDSGGSEPDFIMGFSKLWDSTIDMKNHWMDYSWGANPWVWVIEFERQIVND